MSDNPYNYEEKIEVPSYEARDDWHWRYDLPTEELEKSLYRLPHHSMPQLPSMTRVRCISTQSLPRSPKSLALSMIIQRDSLEHTPFDDVPLAVPSTSNQTLVTKSIISKPPPTLTKDDRSHVNSIFSTFSAPSKISRSSTQQYVFTPTSTMTVNEEQAMKSMSFNGIKQRKPSRRGICNTLTILAVVFVIVFLFAGYPITLYLTKDLEPTKKTKMA